MASNYKVLLPIVIVAVLVTLTAMYRHSANWTVDVGKAQEYARECELIKLGVSVAEVTNTMGQPASTLVEGESTRLLYLVGGLQTEAGFGFEFEGDKLIRKSCGGE